MVEVRRHRSRRGRRRLAGVRGHRGHDHPRQAGRPDTTRRRDTRPRRRRASQCAGEGTWLAGSRCPANDRSSRSQTPAVVAVGRHPDPTPLLATIAAAPSPCAWAGGPGEAGALRPHRSAGSFSATAGRSFISSMKRVGQALQVRLEIDRLFDEAGDAAPLVAICGDFNAESDEVPCKRSVARWKTPATLPMARGSWWRVGTRWPPRPGTRCSTLAGAR